MDITALEKYLKIFERVKTCFLLFQNREPKIDLFIPGRKIPVYNDYNNFISPFTSLQVHPSIEDRSFKPIKTELNRRFWSKIKTLIFCFIWSLFGVIFLHPANLKDWQSRSSRMACFISIIHSIEVIRDARKDFYFNTIA